ncbi:unnamed protein product [Candidula unifasciata]|uniref:Serine carboxypeptidase n=1 Tax=Candidula unifasciata TaxID=100452 RepID=A0A8S3ZRC5_9EUPU|nr:unnamed protein product [Candidula unifasciata]
MLGLLWENGPIRVTETATGDKITYKRWEKSWAESFAMLYIDNPVGTGYSYLDSGHRGWKTTNHGYTEDLFSFISQRKWMIPDYLNTQLHIGGQSYAGKYVLSTNRSAIPLAGIYLGGPFFDPYSHSTNGSRRYNREPFKEYGSDFLVRTKLQLAEIMDNCQVLIYSEDVDGIVTAVNIEEVILSTPFLLQGLYNASDRQTWQNGSIIVGYYIHVGGFCRVIVRNAGHQAPHDQPDITKTIMLDFVRHGCIQ